MLFLYNPFKQTNCTKTKHSFLYIMGNILFFKLAEIARNLLIIVHKNSFLTGYLLNLCPVKKKCVINYSLALRLGHFQLIAYI